MIEINNIEKEVVGLIGDIYKTKNYPNKYDLKVGKEFIESLGKNIAQRLETNIELIQCSDCYYSHHIAISESRGIPLIPSYAEKSKERKNWIKKYGKNHYQMYVAISKLGRYSIFYWTKYSYLLFERQKRQYSIPYSNWQPVITIVSNVLSQMDIKLLPPSLLLRTFNIKFKGENYDNNPSVIKLIFSEELH